MRRSSDNQEIVHRDLYLRDTLNCRSLDAKQFAVLLAVERFSFIEILDLSNLDDHEKSRTFREGRDTALLLTKGISDAAFGARRFN
jgi:hypothetical protein